MLCAKFGRTWPSCSGEEDNDGKSLETPRQTDDGKQAIRKAHVRFYIRLAETVFRFPYRKIKLFIKVMLIMQLWCIEEALFDEFKETYAVAA